MPDSTDAGKTDVPGSADVGKTDVPGSADAGKTDVPGSADAGKTDVPGSADAGKIDLPDSEDGDKTDLLFETYKEVLDATKHQDDKIGRLLTAIAFLTAASLALANLSQGRVIRAQFEVGDSARPLGLWALVAFLLGVFVTVVLLVTSFATPLRLPGLEGMRSDRTRKWLNDVPTSQIYFSEIAQVSREEWQKKWTASAKELKDERQQSLIYETHNLSLRTSFKYNRTSEAISVLSVALLAFALAVVFVAIAASEPSISASRAIDFGAPQRAFVAGLLGFYTLTHLVSRFRYNHQAVTESLYEVSGKERLRYFSQAAITVMIPVGIGTTAASPGGCAPDIAVVVLSLTGFATFVGMVSIQLTRRKLMGPVREVGLATWCFVIVGGLTTLGVVSIRSHGYGDQLLVAVGTSAVLLLSAAALPAVMTHERRADYRRRQEKVASATVANPT